MVELSLCVAIAFNFLGFCGYSLGKEFKMPPECEGKTYCTVQPDYHTTVVGDMDRIINQSKYWAGIGAQTRHFEDLNPIYTPSDDNNCGSVTKVEKPFIIKALVNKTNSQDSQNKLVVQSKMFVQRIRTTSCLDKSIPCFEALKAQQDDIETGCDEKYSTITLYVFDEGKIVPQPFKIPVCCSCKVHFKQNRK